MIGDDVHIDLHAKRVCRINKSAHIGLSAKMGINLREIGDPIAVIASGFFTRPTLHGFVLENWAKPDRRRAKPLDIIKPRDQPFKITTVIKTFVGWIKAGFELIPF